MLLQKTKFVVSLCLMVFNAVIIIVKAIKIVKKLFWQLQHKKKNI